MRVRFYIERRRDAEGKLLTKERPVFMTVSFHGKRAIIATGVRIHMQWWDSNLQRISQEHPESFALNTWLESLVDTAGVTWKALASLSEDPGIAEFRSLFAELRPRMSKGFFHLFYQFMQENHPHWSFTTYQKVKTIYKHLMEFESVMDYPLEFGAINKKFLLLFVEYYRKRGNRESTTFKAVNILVWFLNWAMEKGYNRHREYKNFYRILGKPKDPAYSTVYLGWDELMSLYTFKTGEKKIARVRDLFCLMCFTGLRFSEIRDLKKQDIRHNQVIVRNAKNRDRIVPLNKFGKELTERYENKFFRNGNAFPLPSLITFNKYLKILAKMAGIDNLVTLNSATAPVPKYELLSSGIALNTFLANALLLQIPPSVITTFTGIRQNKRVGYLMNEISRKEIEKFNIASGA